MKVKLLQRVGGEVKELECTVLIVEDMYGNPVQVACEISPGYIELEDIRRQSKFNALLANLGLAQTVICETKAINPATGKLS